VRFSLGAATTEEEVKQALDVLTSEVQIMQCYGQAEVS
jgi:cysteine sulfinate desulfinase/cysteine desulfurase-like protein